jgi:hypothetical protein
MSTDIKGKAIPLQAWTGLEGSRRLRLPEFQDDRHVKVVRLSALRTGRLYPPGNIAGTHFCYRLSRPQGHSAAGRIMSMKISSDTIENRNRNLPVVAQCLSQLRHRVRRKLILSILNVIKCVCLRELLHI